MRICHLIYDDVDNPWLGGGGAVRARQIYRRLADRHEITLVTGAFPGAEPVRQVDGLRLLRVGSPRSYAISRLTWASRAVAALRRLDWDVWVNEFSAYAPLRVPAPVRRRGLLFFQHFMGRHAVIKRPLAGWAALLAERRVLHAYPRILTVSPSLQERVRRQVGAAVPVDCVCNGVDDGYFASSAAEEPYLLYLGRIDVHTKGIDTLLEAFARVAPERPGLVLKIAGGGEKSQVRRLEKLVARTGLGPRVELLGRVSETDKRQLLAASLFFCMPSRYEGWGMTAVEAGASARAVVAADIDGLRDAVLDNVTGLLVPSGNGEALAAAMRRLLDDPGLRRSLGEQGREHSRRFGWDELARRQEEVLISAADAARSRGSGEAGSHGRESPDARTADQPAELPHE